MWVVEPSSRSMTAHRAAEIAPLRSLRRRDLLISLGGIAIMRPRAALSQQKPIPVIGYIGNMPPGPANPLSFGSAAFHQGLSEAGYVEGKNLTIEYRWAEGHYDRLPSLA